MSETDHELLSTAAAARMCSKPESTLRYWRYLGTGPRSFKVGRSVRYRRDDVQSWLTRQYEQNARGDGAA